MKRKPFIRFRAMVWVQNHKSTSKFGGPPDMVIQRVLRQPNASTSATCYGPMRFRMRGTGKAQWRLWPRAALAAVAARSQSQQNGCWKCRDRDVLPQSLPSPEPESQQHSGATRRAGASGCHPANQIGSPKKPTR
jgi:hypothetical protein